MAVQEQVSMFYWMREIAGVFFMIGLICYVTSFFVTDKAKTEEAASATV